MKRFSEQFKKQATAIRLSSSERRDLRERVVAYMEYHPLPSAVSVSPKRAAEPVGIPSAPFLAIPINWFYVRGVAVASCLFLIVTVPVAAEYTAPGDMLYPVKVRFNEEVRSTLTLNPYDKIEWETERLERRIAEARLLASEGKLTDAIEAEVADAVKEHSDSAKAQIAVLRETDQDDAAIAEIAFATALSVQAEVLDKSIAKQQSANGDTPDGADVSEGTVLALVVAEETNEAAASQAAATPSFPKLMARVELETTAAFELFATVKAQASGEEVADIERRLEDIKRKVAKAAAPHAEAAVITEAAPAGDASSTSAVLEAGEAAAATSTETETVAPVATEPVGMTEAEAVEMLRGVMADLRKLIAFMTDIDVRQSVSVEELVPITLTEEERLTQAKVTFETVRNFTAAYTDKNFSGAGSEKITIGMRQLVELQAELEKAFQSGEPLQNIENGVYRAAASVAELQVLIASFSAVPEPVEESTTATTSREAE